MSKIKKLVKYFFIFLFFSPLPVGLNLCLGGFPNSYLCTEYRTDVNYLHLPGLYTTSSLRRCIFPKQSLDLRFIHRPLLILQLMWGVSLYMPSCPQSIYETPQCLVHSHVSSRERIGGRCRVFQDGERKEKGKGHETDVTESRTVSGRVLPQLLLRTVYHQ